MFENAVSIAAQFTQPVITLARKYDGSVSGGVAAFMVLNPDGWFVTAGHVLTPHFAHLQHSAEIGEYEAAVRASTGRRAAKHIKKNREWLTHVTYWWGWDAINASNIAVNWEIDLAVGKLCTF